MNFEFEKNGDSGLLTLYGEIDSAYVDDLRSVLMMSISNTERMVVNFERAVITDPVCFRLFCEAFKAATKLNNHMIFTGCLLMLPGFANDFSNNCWICSDFLETHCLLAQHNNAWLRQNKAASPAVLKKFEGNSFILS